MSANYETIYDLLAELRASDVPADKIVSGIWDDINGRSGCGFDDVEIDIQLEIVEAWREIARKALL